MSGYELVDQVIDSDLPLPCRKPFHKQVLIALVKHANVSGECWPSVGRLVRRTYLSRRQVQRALKDLKEHGVLEVVTRESQHRPPTYRPRGVSLTPLDDDRGAKCDLSGVPNEHSGVPNKTARGASLTPEPASRTNKKNQSREPVAAGAAGGSSFSLAGGDYHQRRYEHFRGKAGVSSGNGNGANGGR